MKTWLCPLPLKCHRSHQKHRGGKGWNVDEFILFVVICQRRKDGDELSLMEAPSQVCGPASWHSSGGPKTNLISTFILSIILVCFKCHSSRHSKLWWFMSCEAHLGYIEKWLWFSFLPPCMYNLKPHEILFTMASVLRWFVVATQMNYTDPTVVALWNTAIITQPMYIKEGQHR